MLVHVSNPAPCRCCGDTTYQLDTNTATAICSDECINTLWENGEYKNKTAPIGEHNEYIFG